MKQMVMILVLMCVNMMTPSYASINNTSIQKYITVLDEFPNGSFEMIFLKTGPKLGGVYKVVFSTLEVTFPEENPDFLEGHCLVELDRLPNENATDYVGVIKFTTSFISVIFLPGTEFPMDAMTFQKKYLCPEYDDMDNK